jgi:hypothetical protein
VQDPAADQHAAQLGPGRSGYHSGAAQLNCACMLWQYKLQLPKKEEASAGYLKQML